MPADKFAKTVNMPASYLAGESPSAPKLSLIGTQLLAAARALENALGDVRGQRDPYVVDFAGGATAEQIAEAETLSAVWGRSGTTGEPLADAAARTLDIVNIARLIGPASNLNPRALEASDVTETIPVGVHEFALRYPVDISLVGASESKYPTSAIVGASTVAISGSNLTTYVQTLADLNASGEWILDAVKGVVYCYTATTSGGTITYPVDPMVFHGGANYPGARFNVIPDPNADISDSDQVLAISGPVDGVYTITLPQVLRQQSNLELNSVELSDGTTYTDLNSEQQLKLPKCLDGLEVGSEIPAGFLLLKHIATGVVYDGATYYYNTSSVFDMAGVTLPSVDGEDYVLITVGTDITTSIDDLRIKTSHAHDRTFGEALVDVNDLTGWNSLPSTRLGGRFPSVIPGNPGPQYLHREGYTTDTNNKDNSLAGALRIRTDLIPTTREKGVRFAVDATGNNDIAIYRSSSNVLMEKGDGTSFDNFDIDGTVKPEGLDVTATKIKIAFAEVPSSSDTLYCFTQTKTIASVDSGDVVHIFETTEDAFSHKRIFSFQVLLMESSDGRWTPPGGTITAPVAYDAFSSDSLGNRKITIVPTTHNGVTFTNRTFYAKIIIWISTDTDLPA
jgi:hypothetical protein